MPDQKEHGTARLVEAELSESSLERDRKQLEKTWAHARGILGWFMEVDH